MPPHIHTQLKLFHIKALALPGKLNQCAYSMRVQRGGAASADVKLSCRADWEKRALGSTGDSRAVGRGEASGILGVIGIALRCSIHGRMDCGRFCFWNSGWIVWQRTQGYSSWQVVADFFTLSRTLVV